MADLKHTPGPWKTEGYDVEAPDGQMVCLMGDDYSFNNNKADAHLIAAAPELYGLLTAIDDMWSDDGDGGRADPIDARSGKVREIWTDIRAALAKARGES